MGKFKIRFKFDKHLLNTLKENSNSGVELRTVKHHLALHPIHLNDFNKSIKDLLNQGIAKYNKNVNGILLGYQDIKLPKNIGLINNDSFYIHTDLQADFFIFKPEIGKEMQGIVNRKSKDHVGVLVYDAFNVSIPNLESDENWLGSVVNIGHEVMFRITYINLSSYLPYIRGELIAIISEIDAGINPTKKIKKLKNNEKLMNKKIIFDEESSIDETPIIKDSKKRKRHKDETPEREHKSKKKKVDLNEEQDSPNLDGAKKKKKKKKNHLEKELEETHDGFKKKNKLKRKNRDEISLSDLQIPELFNETRPSLEPLKNIKSELDFDGDIISSSKAEDDISFIKKKKSKKKDKSKKKQNDGTSIEDSESFNYSDLNSVNLFEDKLKNKKSKKRKLSFNESNESENLIKKHKRKSN